MKLFIVESPTKAKTINSYLGKDFFVFATQGHIKDLPQKEMGIDLIKLEPIYVILPGKLKIVKKIKELAQKSELIILASDRDREGEIIAFHVKELVSKYTKNIQRIEFGEITKNAILEALKNPRDTNINLVNAQKTRRLLDRIVGYILSPLTYKSLRKEVGKTSISVGRVQSPALRLICEREIEIKNFKPVSYYDVFIECVKEGKNFYLKLISEIHNNKEIKFSQEYRIDEKKLKEIKENVRLNEVFVSKIRNYKETIKPLPPFKTSTLQQDASSKLGFPPSMTMKIAQELYEGMEVDGEIKGLITYIRTDSVRISEQALKQVRKFIHQKVGESYLPLTPRIYQGRGNEQDAHECIRPTDVFITPDYLKGKISQNHHKLYDLIWRRFLASQMKDTVIDTLEIIASDGNHNFFGISKSITERNFMDFYPHSIPENNYLPLLKENEKVNVIRLIETKKKTQPPPRYTEATLIKKLEEEGIGRPSTYSTIVTTLLKRKYVEKKNKSLVPTELGFKVFEFLKQNYPDVIDIHLTAYMEELLDKIESGEEKNWKEVLKRLLKKIKVPLNTE
ncbi:MAG: type I DNA topoisomerase [Brevinematia bacterium]